MDINDKFTGGIIGFIVGDALGVPVEFLSRKQMNVKPLTDMIEYGTHHQPKGTWSDDTSMVLATMYSIVEKKAIDYDDIMKKYYEWIRKAKYTATDCVFDVGITTGNAISRFASKGIDAVKCGDTNINQNGNGSLMRMFPIVCYLISNKCSEEESIKIIDNYSSMTHGHEISRLGCKIFYDYISSLFKNNMDKDAALASLKNNNYLLHYSKESISYYNSIIDGSIKNKPMDSIRGSGFVRDTLEAAIWATVNSQSYDESVLKAINLGEDTDTVGAITGCINGIIYGKDSINNNWKDSLKKKDYINDICKRFCDTLLKKNNEHTAAYNYIMSQLKSRRNELNFDYNMLFSLSTDERKEIEKLISLCIMNLNNTSYKYMPYLKYEKIDIEKVISRLNAISIKDRCSFFENYYCLTHDNKYYNYLKEMSVNNLDAFLSLLKIYRMFPNDSSIKDDIDVILNMKSTDNRYNMMFIYYTSFQGSNRKK